MDPQKLDPRSTDYDLFFGLKTTMQRLINL